MKAAVEGELTAEWRRQNPPQDTGAQLLERILADRRARWETAQLGKLKKQGKKPLADWKNRYPEAAAPHTEGFPALPENWEWASLEQIAANEPYSLAIGPFGSNLKVSDYRDDGVPLVFVRNIRSGHYGGQNAKYVTQQKAADLSSHAIAAGDVLVTKMGEPPGDADVYPISQPNGIITADCIKVRCHMEVMHPRFLAFVINSDIGKWQIRPMTQGVAQKKVSLGRFSKLAVPLPPYEEQEAIVSAVFAANEDALKQEAAVQLALQQCVAQRQNILRAAFAGQLVPQDPNDKPASVLLERIQAERVARSPSVKARRLKSGEAVAS